MTTETERQSGTWRVMIDCGAVEEVQVRYSAAGRGEWRATNGKLDGYVVGPSARAAVAALAGWRSWAVVEIRGPGEALRGEMRQEAVAAERARCAAVCREVAADWRGDMGDCALMCAEAIERGAVER